MIVTVARPVRRAIALLASSLAAVTFAPAGAHANGTLSRGACPDSPALTCIVYTGNANEFDAYDTRIDQTTPSLMVVTPVPHESDPTRVGVPIDVGPGCTAGPTAGSVRCSLVATAKFVIRANGGDDWLAKQLNCNCLPVDADMGAGDDLVRGTNFRDVLRGGAGNDFIAAYGGDDLLDGGPGDDEFDPAAGADDVSGGPGYDKITYWKEQGQPVMVTLDDLPNDGEPGEHDNIHSDIEDITGGNGADVLTGNAGANVIRGDKDGDGAPAANGNDTIDGGGGVDALYGQNGNDTILARDGVADTVDCGPGTDTATVDTIDVVRNCETVRASAALEPDADRDGSAKPDDCDDTNPGIRPGIPDTVGNGIDEDCSGADALPDPDADRDGYPASRDCDDRSPTIHPGAAEIRGNGADEDCSGGDLALRRIALDVTLTWAFHAGGRATVSSLITSGLQAGDRIVLTCKGRGCPARATRAAVLRKTKHGKVDLSRYVRGMTLRMGTSISLTVARDQAVTRRVTYTMGKSRPSKRTRCVPPGAKRSIACT